MSDGGSAVDSNVLVLACGTLGFLNRDLPSAGLRGEGVLVDDRAFPNEDRS